MRRGWLSKRTAEAGFVALIALFGWSCTAEDPLELVRPQLENVNKFREMAESNVSHAKSEFASAPDALHAIREKYERLARSGNAYIDALELSLTDKTTRQDFASIVDEIAGSYREFTSTIELERGKRNSGSGEQPQAVSGASPDDVGELIHLLAGVGDSVSEFLKQKKEDEIEKAKAELQLYRWKPWDVVERSSPEQPA